MKIMLWTVSSLLVCLCNLVTSVALENPTNKVVELISQLEAKMIAKGEASQKIYNEFATWCHSKATSLSADLKEDKQDQDDLEAQVAYDTSEIKTEDLKIDREASDIATAESRLESATSVRKETAENFKEEEGELIETISMIKRARLVMQKALKSGQPALVQLKSASSFAQTLRIMVQASVVNSEDARRLSMLVQTTQQLQQQAEDADDEDDSLEEPSASTYASQSHGILTTLSDLLQKAEDELREVRMAEHKEIGNFKLMKQSVTDEIRFSEEEKSEAQKEEAEAKEEKSIDQGDLGMTVKDVQADVKTLSDLRKVCMAKVEEFTAMHKSRDEELKALAEAKKIIKQKTVAASSSAYGNDDSEESAGDADTFLQVAVSSKVGMKVKLAAKRSVLSTQVLHQIRQLARKHGSRDLAQLASRMTATLRAHVDGGGDPFAKVVGMISDMLHKLEEEAADDADHKQYCDKELADALQKKSDRSDTIERLSTKIDQMKSRSSKLKEQVARAQSAMSELASSKAEMDKIRREEHEEFLDEKAGLDEGLEGVKTALKTLQEYYGNDNGHATQASASSNIIGLLEVIESDFSKSLAELMGSEANSVANYQAESKQIEVVTATKEREVMLKTREFTFIDKAVIDSKSDRTGIQNEYSAVIEYLSKLKSECVAKPDGFQERKERREAEIAGLKDALSTLENETAFLQRSSRRYLRGPQSHNFS